MTPAHLLLTDPEHEAFLIQEVRRAFQHGEVRTLAPRLVEAAFTLQPEAPPTLVFARQVLPAARSLQASSINQWAESLFAATAGLPEGQPWQLHIVPHYGAANAGQNRCQLIRDALSALLRRKRRSLFRTLETASAPFRPGHSFVQLLLVAPDRAFLSVAAAPLPFQLRRLVWSFPKGEIPIANDKSAPSRAFAKLLEAEQRFGCAVAPGAICADLGASPGSWSYVALNRGARVTAVDRAPLRADLMSHPRLRFHRGDAFTFEPSAPVDWLLCDVIAAPSRTADLLLRWIRGRWAARFIVTIKFKGDEEYGLLEHLKHALPPLCSEFYLTRLSANKNEVCAFGIVRS